MRDQAGLRLMIGDEVRYGNDLFKIVGAKLTAIVQPVGADERAPVLLDPSSLDRVRPRGRLRACWRGASLLHPVGSGPRQRVTRRAVIGAPVSHVARFALSFLVGIVWIALLAGSAIVLPGMAIISKLADR